MKGMFTVKIFLCKRARKQYLLGNGCMSYFFFFEGEGGRKKGRWGGGRGDGEGGGVPVKFF